MKKLVLAIASGVLAITAIAQDSVTSENIVGFHEMTLVRGYQIISTPFIVGNSTLTDVFEDNLPAGSKIYLWDPSVQNYHISKYIKNFAGEGWSDVSLNIAQPVSYWIDVPSNLVNKVSGNVNSANSVVCTIVPGFQMLSYSYPVERKISELNLTPAKDDQIFKPYFTNEGTIDYEVARYIKNFAGEYWSKDFVIGIGEGFWYNSTADSNTVWKIDKPF